MAPDLSDRDRARFDRLRGRLSGVDRGDVPDPDPPSGTPFDPMLAETCTGSLAGLDPSAWIAERKYDGTRILLHRFDGEVWLHTRRHIERSDTLPRLAEVAMEAIPDGVILDGEYCYFTPGGASRFLPIHGSRETVAREELTGRYVAFDVLATGGEWRLREPLVDRQARLPGLVPSDDMITPVDRVEDGFQAFYDEIIAAGEEGIMVKRAGAPYHPGVRSRHWRKVKAFTEADLLAVGYTSGAGRRADTFGALVLTDGERYVGRVGSGFSEKRLTSLLDRMAEVDDRPVSPDLVGRPYTPVRPFVVRVKFQEINPDGRLRAPVFLGTVEKPIGDVEPIQGE